MTDDRIPVGVIGVGSMGENHARVYSELADAELVGIADRDRRRASEVAHEYGTRPRSPAELLEVADAVSCAVPTSQHYPIARDCLEAGVDVLVEKPFVNDLEQGRELAELAHARDAVLQVGHVERFNPAVDTLMDVASSLDVIAVTANRLGPPTDREIDDNVVIDLMIHDIDILLNLFGEAPTAVSSVGCRDGRYASAHLEFESGQVGTLTASRLTQRRVRRLDLTATDCQVTVDYLDQSVRIHRRSRPEYEPDDGDLLYRHESVTERPFVESEEPLRRELSSFLRAVRERTQPDVTAEDALRVLSVAKEIDAGLSESAAEVVGR